MDIQTPQPNPAQLEEHKSFLARHLLAEVLGTVAFLAFIAGVYYYQQAHEVRNFSPPNPPCCRIKQDQTAEWKEYVNREYGFSFKYPQDWTQRDETLEVFKVDKIFESKTSSNLLQLLVDDQEFTPCEEDCVGHHTEMIAGNNWTIYDLEYQGQQGKAAVIKYNNQYVAIVAGEKVGFTSEIFDQVISTFKFLDSVFCGGIAGLPCPTEGFNCVSQGNYPDAGTTCTRKHDTSSGEVINDGVVSYRNDVQMFKVGKNQKPVASIFDVDYLVANSEECGTNKDKVYFSSLLSQYSNQNATIYTFTRISDSKKPGIYVITVIPNTIGYKDLKTFQADFDICSAGGDVYPSSLNNDWLLFIPACSTGFGSQEEIECEEIKNFAQIKLDD